MRQVVLVLVMLLSGGVSDVHSKTCVFGVNDDICESHGIKLVIKYNTKKLYIRCSTQNIAIDNPDLPVRNQSTEVEEVEIYDCLTPVKSYAESLKAMNFTVSKILELSEQAAEPPLDSDHLRNLSITELKITARYKTSLRPTQDFLEGLPELKSLTLNNVIPEPEAYFQLPTGLETLELNYAELPVAQSKLGNSTWIERLRSLRKLTLMEQMSNTIDVTHKLILPSFGSLENLTTVNMRFIPLELSSLNGKFNSSSIKYLLMYSCGLTNLPESLFVGANLTTLDISSNNLNVTANVFSPLQWLTQLKMDDSQVDSADFFNIVSSLPRLETLSAKENPLGTLCSDEKALKLTLPQSLRNLYLSSTNSTLICPELIQNNQLISLDLSGNDIRYLNYNDLKAKSDVLDPTTKMTINLTNNPNLRIINVSRDDDSVTSTSNLKHAKVLLKVNNLKCDYNSYLLHEIVRNSSWLELKGVIYEYDSGGEVVCPYNEVCLKECSCRWRPRDNVTVVECESALPRAPRWPPGRLALHMEKGTLDYVPRVPLVELYAAYNNITNLDKDDIPSTLQILNLTYNNIRYISESAALELNANRAHLSVYLEGNRLTCDCSNVQTLDLLKDVVRDLNESECIDDINVLDKLHMLHDTCAAQMLPLLLGLPFTLLFLVMVILTSLRFKPQIRQLLFRMGCGRCFIDTIKYDDDLKDVDVFLSYAYPDFQYLSELKNGLESRGYSTLEHNRDWLPGEAIINQITKSVERSRWTLLLVSENYANSQWALKEFHAAHGHALKYQTSRVLVILYDLDHPEKLPLDLQLYLKYNTYLNWRDAKFWPKLYNSMPIRTGEAFSKDVNQQNVIPLSPIWTRPTEEIPQP